MSWLSNFLPDCLRHCPDCLPSVALWTERAILDYESTTGSRSTSRSEWPGNALSFAKGVLASMSFRSEGKNPLSLSASRAQLVLNQQRCVKSSTEM